MDWYWLKGVSSQMEDWCHYSSHISKISEISFFSNSAARQCWPHCQYKGSLCVLKKHSLKNKFWRIIFSLKTSWLRPEFALFIHIYTHFNWHDLPHRCNSSPFKIKLASSRSAHLFQQANHTIFHLNLLYFSL